MKHLPILGVVLALATGCGGDGTMTDASGPADSGASVCVPGCMATIAAGCTGGPPSQAVCEADCEMLRAGMCGSEYDLLLTCAMGQNVTCDAGGIPTVTACATEQAAFVACLNM